MDEIETKWIVKETPPEDWGHDEALPAMVNQLMRQRGVDSPEDVERFLRPKLRDLSDPYLLSDMELAVERIFRAIDTEQAICIYGDYDVDGVSSVTVLRQGIEAYGVKPKTFIPHRGTEGYGLSQAAIERLYEERGKPDLLITVDCGTASLDEIATLKQDGVDVIVVDHHEISAKGRPDCVALVNPKMGEELHYLCAAAVVFKLVHAMQKRRRVADFDLRDCLDIVSVATIADIVPLVGENRLIVRHGLRRLSASKNIGLLALQDVAGVGNVLTSMDVGFRIGPRINAAGRMDAPEDALAILNTLDRDEAKSLAETLDEYNIERQRHEKQIREEALAAYEQGGGADEPVIVLGSREWHPGVVGIVASRLMRQFHKPTFIIAIDENGVGKGSGRSVEGVSLVAVIEACREHLLAGGGHEMAAGLSVEENSITAFRAAFADYVMGHTSAEQRLPKLHIDAEIEFGDLSLEFLDSYDLLQPFGNANPQPVFMARSVWLTEAPRRLKNNHIKLFLRQEYVERDAIFFGGGERQLPDPPWDIAFTVDRNTFRGRTSLQIVIQDVRSAQRG